MRRAGPRRSQFAGQGASSQSHASHLEKVRPRRRRSRGNGPGRRPGLQLQPRFLHLQQVHTNLRFEAAVRVRNRHPFPVRVHLEAPQFKRYQVVPADLEMGVGEERTLTVLYCILSRDRLDPNGHFHKRAIDRRGHRDPCLKVDVFNLQTGQTAERFLFSAYITFFEDGRNRDWGAMFGRRKGGNGAGAGRPGHRKQQPSGTGANHPLLKTMAEYRMYEDEDEDESADSCGDDDDGGDGGGGDGAGGHGDAGYGGGGGGGISSGHSISSGQSVSSGGIGDSGGSGRAQGGGGGSSGRASGAASVAGEHNDRSGGAARGANRVRRSWEAGPLAQDLRSAGGVGGGTDDTHSRTQSNPARPLHPTTSFIANYLTPNDDSGGGGGGGGGDDNAAAVAAAAVAAADPPLPTRRKHRSLFSSVFAQDIIDIPSATTGEGSLDTSPGGSPRTGERKKTLSPPASPPQSVWTGGTAGDIDGGSSGVVPSVRARGDLSPNSPLTNTSAAAAAGSSNHRRSRSASPVGAGAAAGRARSNSATSTGSVSSTATEGALDVFELALSEARRLHPELEQLFLPLHVSQAVSFYDPTYEAEYYFNPATGESSWEAPTVPADAPGGMRLWADRWQPIFDLGSNAWFFYDHQTGVSQYEVPAPAAVPVLPPGISQPNPTKRRTLSNLPPPPGAGAAAPAAAGAEWAADVQGDPRPRTMRPRHSSKLSLVGVPGQAVPADPGVQPSPVSEAPDGYAPTETKRRSSILDRFPPPPPPPPGAAAVAAGGAAVDGTAGVDAYGNPRPRTMRPRHSSHLSLAAFPPSAGPPSGRAGRNARETPAGYEPAATKRRSSILDRIPPPPPPPLTGGGDDAQAGEDTVGALRPSSLVPTRRSLLATGMRRISTGDRRGSDGLDGTDFAPEDGEDAALGTWLSRFGPRLYSALVVCLFLTLTSSYHTRAQLR